MKSNMKHYKNILFIFFLQLSVIIYTMAGVCSKYASSYDMFSLQFILIYCLEIVILGIYAVLWQQIIKRIDLFVAYANKGSSLLWSLLWAKLLFKESITISNILGIIVVMFGIILINTDSAKRGGKWTLDILYS